MNHILMEYVWFFSLVYLTFVYHYQFFCPIYAFLCKFYIQHDDLFGNFVLYY